MSHCWDKLCMPALEPSWLVNGYNNCLGRELALKERIFMILELGQTPKLLLALPNSS